MFISNKNSDNPSLADNNVSFFDEQLRDQRDCKHAAACMQSIQLHLLAAITCSVLLHACRGAAMKPELIHQPGELEHL
jgi:hypothetical protein